MAELVLDVVNDSKPYSPLTHIGNISDYLLAVSLLQLVLICLGVTVAVLDAARTIITVIARPQSDSMNHAVTNEPMISIRVWVSHVLIRCVVQIGSIQIWRYFSYCYFVDRVSWFCLDWSEVSSQEEWLNKCWIAMFIDHSFTQRRVIFEFLLNLIADAI